MAAFLQALGGSLVSGIQGEAQQAADSATQAFYVIAAELAIIAILLFLILRGK
jgi:hypothetical protein